MEPTEEIRASSREHLAAGMTYKCLAVGVGALCNRYVIAQFSTAQFAKSKRGVPVCLRPGNIFEQKKFPQWKPQSMYSPGESSVQAN